MPISPSPILSRAAALLLATACVVPALADAPSTRPSGDSDRLSGLLDRMRQSRDAEEEPATQPATRPSDDEVADAEDASERVSPAELIRQMRQKAEEEKAKPLVAQLDLSLPITEQPPAFNLFGGAGGMDLRSVLGRLKQAEEDPEVKAVLLTFYNGGLMNYAQAQEVRSRLDALRRAGKRTFAYADTYDTVSYLVASACTDVVLMDGGELFLPGVAVEPMFYKGTLDLLGVVPQYVQIGEYKGAEEPYTRSEPSPEFELEMNKLVDGLYGQIVGEISAGRSLGKAEVEEAIDRAMTPALQAQQLGFVDHLADADGLRKLMEDELGAEPRVDAEYGGVDDEPEFDPENPLALLRMLRPQEVDATQPSVAIVYAEGPITDGTGGGGGLFGGESGVNTDHIRRAMRAAARDDEVKAVVLRIDSPGGSALASEAMYQAVQRLSEDKPVIVSIGGTAASGGYYLAVAGDLIYADPAAVIGSIGVVGGKLVLDGLYDKIGLSTTQFSRGRNAGLFSDTQPWDDRQRRLVRNWMRSTYDQFTDRVQEGRGEGLAAIDEVARGRIFLAAEGKTLGMVDELGGLEDALAAAAEAAQLGDEYDVVVLPGSGPTNPFAAAGLPLGEGGEEQSAAALLAVLPPTAREAISRLITTSQLLSERPVILMAPFSVRIR